MRTREQPGTAPAAGRRRWRRRRPAPAESQAPPAEPPRHGPVAAPEALLPTDRGLEPEPRLRPNRPGRPDGLRPHRRRRPPGPATPVHATRPPVDPTAAGPRRHSPPPGADQGPAGGVRLWLPVAFVAALIGGLGRRRRHRAWPTTTPTAATATRDDPREQRSPRRGRAQRQRDHPATRRQGDPRRRLHRRQVERQRGRGHRA